MLITGIYGGTGSGRLGSVVAARNRGGQYLRQFVKPVNPESELQGEIRNFFSVLSQAWQESLTEAQRTGWSAYAQTITFRNRIGNARELTGATMFIRCNTPRLQARLPIVLVAPTDFTVGEAPKIMEASLVLTSAPVGTPNGKLEVRAQFITEPPENTNVLIWISSPRAITRNFFKGPYRFAAKGLVSTEFVDLTVPVVVPVEKPARIFFRMRASYADGRLSQSFVGQADAVLA